MCGIAGLLSLDGARPVEPSRLARMRDVIRHRGPDDQGSFLDGPVGLAARRLAIVDVPGGHQPLSNEDGSAWIAFNGEIYNHPRLSRELAARGHVYRSHADTETVLHLYEEYGDRCVDHLQGMFAFAIWDRPKRRLLLARDRLGIKPLYYALTEHELIFGSEIKAVLAAGAVRPAFNRAVLPEFLGTGFVSGEETFFRGVRKLLPGRLLTWTRHEGVRQRRYWQLRPQPAQPGTLQDHARELRARLEQTVESHLMSDVPLGVFLSGGLDSTGLAGLMAPKVSGRLRTFSVGFAERDANELAYARLAAERLDAEHHEVVVTPQQFFDALPSLVWHEDEPIAFPSSVPLYFVSKLAREHVKVVLTGEGADELFLGYNRYRVAAWNARLGRPYWAVVPPRARRQVRHGVAALPSSIRRVAGRSFLAAEPGPRDLFCDSFAVFPQAWQARLLPPTAHYRDPFAAALDSYEDGAGGMLERMSHADVHTYLVELLMKQDQMSMAASVESRVPFLDHLLVEYAAGIPARHKLRGWQTKAVLREAMKDLIPQEILTRKKMGFPTPIGAWLRGPFSGLLDELVLGPRAVARGYFHAPAVRQLVDEHRAGRANHGARLWLLVNLELWHRVLIEGEPADAATVRGLVA
jgi:asparagine synthase (glutamine-hydrolysing)